VAGQKPKKIPQQGHRHHFLPALLLGAWADADSDAPPDASRRTNTLRLWLKSPYRRPEAVRRETPNSRFFEYDLHKLPSLTDPDERAYAYTCFASPEWGLPGDWPLTSLDLGERYDALWAKAAADYVSLDPYTVEHTVTKKHEEPAEPILRALWSSDGHAVITHADARILNHYVRIMNFRNPSYKQTHFPAYRSAPPDEIGIAAFRAKMRDVWSTARIDRYERAVRGCTPKIAYLRALKNLSEARRHAHNITLFRAGGGRQFVIGDNPCRPIFRPVPDLIYGLPPFGLCCGAEIFLPISPLLCLRYTDEPGAPPFRDGGELSGDDVLAINAMQVRTATKAIAVPDLPENQLLPLNLDARAWRPFEETAFYSRVAKEARRRADVAAKQFPILRTRAPA